MTAKIVPLYADQYPDDSNGNADFGSAPTAIFRQDWWLDAVAPGAWHQVVVRQGDELIGQLPFASQRRFGMTCLVNPPLTPSLGPWLRSPDGKPPSYQEEQDILTLLIQSLPAFESFDVTFAPISPGWQPFSRAGFESENQITFRIEDLQGTVQNHYDRPLEQREPLDRIGSQFEIRTDFGIEAFAVVYERLAERLPNGYDHAAFRRLDAACRARNAGAGFVAIDLNGVVRAAQYLVWDKETAYLLLSAPDPAEDFLAARWLTWHSIQHAAKQSASFDFLGSMNRDSEMLMRDFGAEAVTSLHVWRNSRRLRALELLAGVVKTDKVTRNHHTGRIYAGRD